MNPLLEQSSIVNIMIFCIAAAGVWRAGSVLPLFADAISDRLRIGKAFAGFVFLAGATSLPEIVTTVTGALAGEPHLVLGTLFGGIAMRTATLAAADATVASLPLTFYPRKPECALQATLLALQLTLLIAIATMGDRIIKFDIGLGTVVLAVVYLAILAILNAYESSDTWQPVEVLETSEQAGLSVSTKRLDDVPLRNLIVKFGTASIVILLCGVALTAAAALAEQTGLGSSFFGVTLLALATSLPELSTTFAAVRLGAYTMAVSNIFGSNLLMIALVFPADIAYIGGPLLDAIDGVTLFALICGLAVTLIYLAGLLIRSRRRIGRMGIDSALVIAGYLLSLLLLNHMR